MGNFLEEALKENQNTKTENCINGMKRLESIMNKRQILENIYDSSAITEKDKKIIEEIFTSSKMGIRTSATERIQEDIIRKYRPEYFE